MQTLLRNTLKLTALLILVIGLVGAGFTQAQAASLPPTSACTGAGTGTVTCNLWAETGTFTPPGGPVTKIWGYADSDLAANTLALPGGPVLIANQGDVVTVNLKNDLPESTSLLFQGQSLIPDTTGVAAGGTKSYTFTAGSPGTFLYEAGFEAVEASVKVGRQHQTAMGLHGALVVRPSGAPLQAYAGAVSAFNEEALVVLSEIDTVLNNSASPTTFDLRKYNPQYFLINSKSYPNTDPIAVTAGNKVLLRYVNAGLQSHAMNTLGLTQKIVGQDGHPYAIARSVVSETIATGQTLDVIVTIPAAATGAQFPLYDANMLLHNSNTAGIGGMLTFLNSGGTPPPPPPGDTTGSVVSGLNLSPNPTNGVVAVTVTGSVSDVATGNSNITAARFFIDTTGGTPTAMTAVDGTFDSPTESVTGSISIATLATLSAGNHNIYVQGQDSAGNWGTFLSVVLNLDKAGPTSSALALSPNPSVSGQNVALTATGSDVATGNSNVTAAEYWVDAGAHVAMTVGAPAPSNSLSATIPGGLAQGSHVVSVRSQDSFGNWGPIATITLVVGDTVAPTTSGISASPAANNGSTPFNTSVLAVRVSASFSDVATGNSNIAAAEGFIDTVGAAGSGFVFIATDGIFNAPAETGYADVPLVVINALSSGNHTINVRAKDAAGNWGAIVNIPYLIDRTLPTFTSISLSPANPVFIGTPVTLTVNGANDPLSGGLASGVSRGEYWFGTTNPAPGGGTSFNGLTASIPTTSLAAGSYTVRARVRDVAGNWSTTIASATLTVVPDAIFANGFETTPFPVGWSSRSTTNTTRLNRSTASTLVGIAGMQAQGNNTNYVQYNFGGGTNPATGTFDARFYFNPHGNTSTGQDIFAAATSSAFGTQLLHVRYRVNAGTPQVQVQVGTTANAAWINTTNAAHYLEVVWQAGSAGTGSLKLYVDGTLVQTLAHSNTGQVSAVRLGSVTSGGSSTLEYFDAFSAKRSIVTLIGP